nr:chromate transporter [Culturomica massiliensis]
MYFYFLTTESIFFCPAGISRPFTRAFASFSLSLRHYRVRPQIGRRTKENSVYRRLFITFVKTGMFTIGGGYAMIPLTEREVVMPILL